MNVRSPGEVKSCAACPPNYDGSNLPRDTDGIDKTPDRDAQWFGEFVVADDARFVILTAEAAAM